MNDRRRFVLFGMLVGAVIAGLTGYTVYSSLQTFIILVITLIGIPAGFIGGAIVGFALSHLKSSKLRNTLVGAAIGLAVGGALAVLFLVSAEFTIGSIVVAGATALASMVFGGVYGLIVWAAENGEFEIQEWIWKGSLISSLSSGGIAYSTSNGTGIEFLSYLAVALVIGLIAGMIFGAIGYFISQSKWVIAIVVTVVSTIAITFAVYLFPTPDISPLDNIVNGMFSGLILGLVLGLIFNLAWLMEKLESKIARLEKGIVLMQERYDEHLTVLHQNHEVEKI